MVDCPKNDERFLDFDKCIKIIEDLSVKLDPIDKYDEYKSRNESEKLVESFKKAIDPYQEQPELLEPYLAELISKLTAVINDLSVSSNRYHTNFKFLYQLIKVTGFKTIINKFPHEANQLPLLIELLCKEDLQDKYNWQTRYVLTVWLSIAILTPFDLKKFDSDSKDQNISDKIYSALMKSLLVYGSSQHASAFCLAKFFSRPDMIKSEYLNSFIKSALQELSNVKLGVANSMDDIRLIGYLQTLCYMFKFLTRAEMKKRCQDILEVCLKLNIEQINRELINHLIIKLIQRAGLSLLPKRLASWRYKRGSRILGYVANNSNDIKPASEHVMDVEQSSNDIDEEEFHSEEHLESILSLLFVAAQNSQTKIRWSASKGIARMASRLSKERASEVISMVLENFFDEVSSSEFAWHGGCLTLAEMSRHGLILEEKIGDVIKVVSKAIIYDKIKGSSPIGAHVREGACYVCWAMARTYEDQLLKPYIPSISINLLCTMLFDRELQCRRAASATFQELVGRQGTFNDEGINILTNVDYQNVGQRQFAYLHLALQVASYGENYSKPFVDHLLEKKIGHWDVQIRRLACDSLSALMLHSKHTYIKETVLPKILKMIDGEIITDNNVKHGAILALAKLIRGLVPLEFEFGQEIRDFVGNIVRKCDKQLKSKQQAPNFIEAIGCIISSAEIAKFEYSTESESLKQWETISLTALDSDNPSLRDIGADALLTLYRSYYKGNKFQQDRLLTVLNKSLSNLNESSRCGALKALAKLGRAIETNPSVAAQVIKTDADTPDIILTSLTSYIAKDTHEKSTDIVFAQAKAEACESFVNFIKCLDKSQLIILSRFIKAGYEALLEKSEDYTFDKRGDIGVVVRRASIKALQELTSYLLSINYKSILDSELVKSIIARTLQQAVSYHNSARESAAIAFYKLVGSDLPDETIPHKSKILNLFEKYGVNDDFIWRDDSTPIFVNLLACPEYSVDLWTGLLPSVGQVSDLCAKQFRDALSDYILSLQEKSVPEGFSTTSSELEQVFESFLITLERKDMADRLLTSGLIVADYLLTQGLMNGTSAEFGQRLASFAWQSRNKRAVTTASVGAATTNIAGASASGSDPKRLISVARVLSSMLQFRGPIQRDCLKYCLELLGNGYAKVRAETAEQLYLSIMTYQTDLEENLSQVGDCCKANEEVESKEGTGSSFSSAFTPASSSSDDQLDLSTAMDLLSQTNWREPLEKVKPVRDKICACLGLAETGNTK